MRQLYTLMGQRRQVQIDHALGSYTEKQRNRGTNNPGSKITEDHVREIKVRLQNGEKPRAIAADYDISYYSVINIKLGRTWNHIDM